MRPQLTLCCLSALLLLACSSDTVVGPVRGGPDRLGETDGGRGTTTDASPAQRDVDSVDTGDGADAGPPTDAETSPEDATLTETGTVDVGPTDTAAVDTAVPDVPTGPGGGVAGTVWAPGNAPGMVPTGQEIPIAGALVYLSDAPAAPIPNRAYCAACDTTPSRATFSASDGRFVVDGYVSGTYWLVIEKGQFRIEQEIEIVGGTLVPMDAADTTLPSDHDPERGHWVPRIAMAGGSFDHLEDILGKMGLGSVDGSGAFVPESSPDAIDIYDNGGLGTVAVGSLGELVRDLDRLLDYHILFIPCSGDGHTGALSDQAVLRNLRDYVAAGGNLYVTDWSGEWADNVFPAQVELGDGFGGFLGGGNDTPASAYNAASDTWNTSQFGSADGDSYDTPNAEATDPDLRAWLHGQQGPTAHSDAQSTYDASRFEVEGNWNTIESVNEVEVGVDRDGAAITDAPVVWVSGGSTSSPTPRKPLTVSYEPAGCGRVVYSTYHTTDDRHIGLAPQERVLLYLIMEIGTCRDPKR